LTVDSDYTGVVWFAGLHDRQQKQRKLYLKNQSMNQCIKNGDNPAILAFPYAP
jgi:hypothetical protein